MTDKTLKNLSRFINETVFWATADKAGSPNLIAVEINKITPQKEIIITDNHIVQSIKNIKENNKCVLLVTNNKDIWWRIFGTASYQEKGKWADYVKKLDTNKGYSPKGAIIVKIIRIDDLNTGAKNI